MLRLELPPGVTIPPIQADVQVYQVKPRDGGCSYYAVKLTPVPDRITLRGVELCFQPITFGGAPGQARDVVLAHALAVLQAAILKLIALGLGQIQADGSFEFELEARCRRCDDMVKVVGSSREEAQAVLLGRGWTEAPFAPTGDTARSLCPMCRSTL